MIMRGHQSKSFTMSPGPIYRAQESNTMFWGCELTKDKPSHLWSYEEEEDDVDYLDHKLFLKHAVLGKGAKQDERNIIQVETKSLTGEEIKQPVFSLTLGMSDMCSLDINFSQEIPVTFRLVEGSGPVYLSGQEISEFPIEDEDNQTATETEYSEEEEEIEDVDLPNKKRKATNGVAKGKKKRGKIDSDTMSNGDDAEEEEDEEEEEEETMETSEEEEEEEEEEDEEEETPKKKAKAKKGKAASTSKAKAAKKAKITPKASKGTAKTKAR